MPTAIVQFCLTAERGLALVLTRTQVVAVPLPGEAGPIGTLSVVSRQLGHRNPHLPAYVMIPRMVPCTPVMFTAADQPSLNLSHAVMVAAMGRESPAALDRDALVTVLALPINFNFGTIDVTVPAGGSLRIVLDVLASSSGDVLLSADAALSPSAITVVFR